MKLYLTTSKQCRSGLYMCSVFDERPIMWPEGFWVVAGKSGNIAGENLAPLGFPPPGEMRVVETGPCEEGE